MSSKLLLSLSLLLNVVFVVIMLLFWPREADDESASTGNEIAVAVPLTKEADVPVELETKLINLQTDLAEQKAAYEQQLLSLRGELVQAEKQLKELEQGMLPPLVIPSGPQETGVAFGKIQHELIKLRMAFPETPDQDADNYNEYILWMDQVMLGLAPVHSEAERLRKLPGEDPQLREFISTSLGTTLGVDASTQSKIDALYDAYYKKAIEAELIGKRPSHNDAKLYDQWWRERKQLSEQATAEIKELLPPDKQKILEDFYHPNNVLYSAFSKAKF